MPRYKLTIEYDGTLFAGWQRQANAPSVQQALEEAIAAFAGEAVTVHGAGRTDAGVHARGQVAHIDLAAEWRPDTVRDAVNAHLKPHSIAVLATDRADATFHARFSAVRRCYDYLLISRRAPLALDRCRAWRVPVMLDGAAMHAAAQLLVGRHDFTTFRAAECQAKSPDKTLERLDVVCDGAAIVIHAAARSFLHHQVRSMVGTLKLVGEGRWQPGQVGAALAARDRAACGPVAPACGLTLMRVDYP